jgi:hypothetical protein
MEIYFIYCKYAYFHIKIKLKYLIYLKQLLNICYTCNYYTFVTTIRL